MRAFWRIIRETYSEWGKDKAPQQAAALAFYTIFSLAPLLLVVISIAGLVWGREAAHGAMMRQMEGLLGRQGAQMLQTMMQHVSRPGTNVATAAIGIAILLMGAGGVFSRLQEMMNTIWDVQPKPGLSLWIRLRERFLSFGMLLGVGFLLLVSLVVSAGLSALGRYMSGWTPGREVISQAINALVSIGVVGSLFAMIFKVLPDVHIAWRDVWIGALATAVLFTIGKSLIGLYLGKSAVSSAYGAAGSLVVILLWLYYSAQILFFGAEFTKVWARRHGKGIQPASTAVPT